MPDKPPVVTDSYGPDMAMVYEAIRDMSESIHRQDHRTADLLRIMLDLQTELHRLREAWSVGGLKGLRAAARNGANDA